MKTIIILFISLFYIAGILIPARAIAQAPDWAMGISAGGNKRDIAYSIATDSSGCVYVTGTFQSRTIIFGSDTLTNSDTSLNGNTFDLFLVKYSVSGNVLWAKSTGGFGGDAGFSVVVDVSGNVIMVGYFQSPFITFDTVTLINASSGSTDMFIVKYNTNGNVLWAKRAGGVNYDSALSVKTDASGNIYFGGSFSNSSIIFGPYTLFSQGYRDMFLVKYDSNGNALWATSAGGSYDDRAFAVTIDTSGNVYVAGDFSSTSIQFGSIILVNDSVTFSDTYVVKYSPNGIVQWAKGAGGKDEDVANCIAVDGLGNVYVGGYFYSITMNIGPNTLNTVGSDDMFLLKYDAAGNISWVKSAGGFYHDYSESVTVDISGNVYVVGGFQSHTIAFGSDSLTNVSVGSEDMFFVKYNSNGNLLWAKSAGGINGDVGYSVTIDRTGNIYVTGYFYSPYITFDTISLSNIDTLGFTTEMFIAKINGTTTGIENSENNNGVIVAYPNPSSDFFTIQIVSPYNQRCLLIIKDLTGRIIERRENIFVNENINFGNHLPNGVYFAEVIQGSSKKVIRIIKSR